MKYWIRSCTPLVYKAAWIETTYELIQWIEEILEASWKESRSKGISLIPPSLPGEKPFNLFEDGFVLKKVIPQKWEKILKGEYYYVLRRKKNFPHIEKELERIKGIKKESRGRKKKIIMQTMEELNATRPTS